MSINHIRIMESALEEIERRWPKRSVTIARVLAYLIQSGAVSVPDLGDALGHGRDSTLVQGCCIDLTALGLAEMTGDRPKVIRSSLSPSTKGVLRLHSVEDVLRTAPSLRAAAKQLGVQLSALRGFAKKHNIDTSKFTPVDVQIEEEKFLRMTAEGKLAREIAAAFDVQPQEVYRFARKRGLQIPKAPKGRQRKQR